MRVLNHLLQMIENDNKLFFKHLMHISKVCSFGQILLLIIFITVQNKKNSDKILFWKKQLGRGFILSTAIQLSFFTHTSLSIFIQRRTLLKTTCSLFEYKTFTTNLLWYVSFRLVITRAIPSGQRMAIC